MQGPEDDAGRAAAILLARGVVRVLATMKIDNEPAYKEVLQQYPIPGVN
ncbi:hypothetical protein [Bradyrhizobium sp. WSM2254]|nr:hypothetical protein [Bradyrhizobium sp. WSM2254]